MMRASLLPLLLVPLLLLPACGDGEGDPRDDRDVAAPESGLTDFELEHGIGPFDEEIVLDAPLDPELAAMGQGLFEMYCDACHLLDERLVGPPARGILAERGPTWIANFVMNPAENVREHPIGQELLREYMIIMPYQNISEEQARALVEYFRTLE